jgi:hypothetical protein
MALWLRRRVRHVSIIPNEDEGSLGHLLPGKSAHVEPETKDPSAKTQFQLERLALVSLAGNAAECLLTNRKCFAGSDSDFFQAWDYLHYLTGSEDETRAYISWLSERAKTTLSSSWNWFAVETLANELLKQKYIGAKRVHQIVRQAWKNLPTMT